MIQFSMAHPSLEGPGNLKVVQCLPVVFRWVLLLPALMGSLKEVISFGCTHGQPQRGRVFQTLSPKDTNCLLVLDVHA